MFKEVLLEVEEEAEPEAAALLFLLKNGDSGFVMTEVLEFKLEEECFRRAVFGL